MTRFVLTPLAALRTRRAARWSILTGIAAILLVAHGCHGDDVDHELGVPVPLKSQQQDSTLCPD